MNFNNLSESLKKQLKTAKELASNRLLRANFFGNVAGVGIGEKVVDGDPTGNACVRIYVQSKIDLDDLMPSSLLPSSFLDIPTDIIPVGRLGLAKVVGKPPDAPLIRPGSLVRLRSGRSNLNSGAVGTLGAIVVDKKGDPYILGCNHILNANGRVNKDPKAEIVSGDPGFGEKPPTIAAPSDYFVRLNRNGKNYVDCALAKIDSGLLQDPESLASGKPQLQAEFAQIGSVNSTFAVEPFVGQIVMKTGAVTGVTQGVVVDVDADFYIDYGFGTFLFTNQVVIDGKGQGNFKDKDQFKDIFATDGDSGAIAVNEQKQAVAMIFAEAGRFAVACKFSKVLEEIGFLFNRVPVASKTPKRRVKPTFTIIKDSGDIPRSKKY